MASTATIDTQKIKEIHRFRDQLHEAGIPFHQLILFGSHARGTAKPWSDIDICVVSNLFGHDRQAERVTLMQVKNDSTIDIEPHPYHPDDLANPWDPLAAEIRTHGIILE